MVECELITHPSFSVFHSGFNRYMVECEYQTDQAGTLAESVLIDTWWNVNYALQDDLVINCEF